MIEAFYFCYFVAVGTLVPFFPPYLRGLGLSGGRIALLLTVSPALYLGVPLAWGWLADKLRHPGRVLGFVSLGAAVSWIPVASAQSFGALLPAFAVYCFFAVAIIGLADALAFDRARAGGDYGRIRLWGSVSFILVSLALGQLLEARGGRAADPLVPRV